MLRLSRVQKQMIHIVGDGKSDLAYTSYLLFNFWLPVDQMVYNNNDNNTCVFS